MSLKGLGPPSVELITARALIDARSPKGVACRGAGCNSCCFGGTAVLAEEAERLRWNATVLLSDEPERAARLDDNLGPCVFDGDERGCLVYHERPLACRGVTSWTHCPTVEGDGDPHVVSPATVVSKKSAASASWLHAALKKAMRLHDAMNR